MNITVWWMSLILIHMTYFSFYTIWILEHYRAIVGYIPTPGQQVDAILRNITITVKFQSQVHHVTYYFVFMIDFFASQKYSNTLPSNYFFVPGARFWTIGHFEGLENFQCTLQRIITLSRKQNNISKGKWDILEILILLFDLSFFNVELL